ncbi:MAG: hypothetical protein ACRYG7_46755 [Janthinobacterium lividum]
MKTFGVLSIAVLTSGALAAQLTVTAWGHPTTQGRPRPKATPARGKALATGKVLAPYGAKADSLDGIPGHHFGEPRSNFPELETRGFHNLDGYMSYSPRADQPAPGWFGKHADQLSCTYWFRNDQFAGFTASQHGPDGQRQLLAEEAFYLFGPGKRKSAAFGQTTTQWDGRKVLVEYVDGHNEAILALNSKPVLAQVAADKLAKQQAAAAARAASLKADNAPAGH